MIDIRVLTVIGAIVTIGLIVFFIYSGIYTIKSLITKKQKNQ